MNEPGRYSHNIEMPPEVADELQERGIYIDPESGWLIAENERAMRQMDPSGKEISFRFAEPAEDAIIMTVSDKRNGTNRAYLVDDEGAIHAL